MKVVCAAKKAALDGISTDSHGILLFGRDEREHIGSVGAAVKEYIVKHKFLPDPKAWDFVAIALSVFAADLSVPRGGSADGWTRQIDLNIAVSDPDFWTTQCGTLEKALQFLTTDQWKVSFSGDGDSCAVPNEPQYFPETSISLLSGGLDSLIGAVDLAAKTERVLLVSQVADGDKGRQAEFARSLGLTHLQLTHGEALPGTNESTTRSRSIVFISYGVLAASLLTNYKSTSIVVRTPENGFMSINPPLTDARLGALSTRTTHPVFIHHIQSLLDGAGLRVRMTNPYQFKTKGEMLTECLNQNFIKSHAHEATSCGRFVRTQYRHCGRCVPCIIRRAAIHKASLVDQTDYKFKLLRKNDADHSRFDDVRSAALAVAVAETDGLNAWLGTSLTSNALKDSTPYRDVVGRGLIEVGQFLKAAGVK